MLDPKGDCPLTSPRPTARTIVAHSRHACANCSCILVGSGIQTEDARRTRPSTLLQRFDSLHGIAKVNPPLRSAKSALSAPPEPPSSRPPSNWACVSTCRQQHPRPQIRTPNDDLPASSCSQWPRSKSSISALLDTKSFVSCVHTVDAGSLNAAVVRIGAIFREPVRRLAASDSSSSTTTPAATHPHAPKMSTSLEIAQLRAASSLNTQESSTTSPWPQPSTPVASKTAAVRLQGLMITSSVSSENPGIQPRPPPTSSSTACLETRYVRRRTARKPRGRERSPRLLWLCWTSNAGRLRLRRTKPNDSTTSCTIWPSSRHIGGPQRPIRPRLQVALDMTLSPRHAARSKQHPYAVRITQYASPNPFNHHSNPKATPSPCHATPSPLPAPRCPSFCPENVILKLLQTEFPDLTLHKFRVQRHRLHLQHPGPQPQSQLPHPDRRIRSLRR